jgi:hypothetical protein
MANPGTSGEGGSVELRVTAKLEHAEQGESLPKAAAYAFTSGGKLLARQPLGEDGSARLKVPAGREASGVRVVVGPVLAKDEVTLAELLRHGGQESHVRIDPGRAPPAVEISVIPPIWRCWFLRLCFVRGTLLKRSVSGGVSIDLPVCRATVYIYDVEPFIIIISRLPDDGLERIRHLILAPRAPVPLPPPPPPPPDGPFGLIPPAVPASLSRSVAAAAAGAPTTLHAKGEVINLASSALDGLRSLALTASPHEFRQALIANEADLRELFCLYFPWFVTTTLVATAETDECGHFSTFFFRGCFDTDAPNLYFTATQRWFFFDIQVYGPTPIWCYTFWNYACGSEVTLYTTHPLAITCPPCPPIVADPNWVLVMAVGNFPLSRIRGTGQTLQATTNATNLGLTDGGAPFGGLLRMRVEFDNSLRDSLNVRYYQVSFRRGTAGAFIPLTGEVHRHYTHVIGGNLVLEVLPLGPKVVNGVPNLFEIPPALPPLGQYSFPDLLEDLTSAKFPSDALAPAADADQLKLDLFDINGAPVNIAALGIHYVVPTSTDLSGTIQTTDAAPLGLVSGNSFIMTLHVDNNPCAASIAAPTLNGTPAGDDCGVLRYDPQNPGSVTMAYTATHPNGFATYSFGVVRGIHPVAGAGGPVVPGTSSITETVTTLLGGCDTAGFSENLYVAALAIDGWGRLSGYDRSDVRAFVLAPPQH